MASSASTPNSSSSLNRSTRQSHPTTHHIPSSWRTSRRQQSFFPLIISECNKLPSQVVEAPSVDRSSKPSFNLPLPFPHPLLTPPTTYLPLLRPGIFSHFLRYLQQNPTPIHPPLPNSARIFSFKNYTCGKKKKQATKKRNPFILSIVIVPWLFVRYLVEGICSDYLQVVLCCPM